MSRAHTAAASPVGPSSLAPRPCLARTLLSRTAPFCRAAPFLRTPSPFARPFSFALAVRPQPKAASPHAQWQRARFCLPAARAHRAMASRTAHVPLSPRGRASSNAPIACSPTSPMPTTTCALILMARRPRSSRCASATCSRSRASSWGASERTAHACGRHVRCGAGAPLAAVAPPCGKPQIAARV